MSRQTATEEVMREMGKRSILALLSQLDIIDYQLEDARKIIIAAKQGLQALIEPSPKFHAKGKP